MFLEVCPFSKMTNLLANNFIVSSYDFLYLCIIGCYFTSVISYFVWILSLYFLISRTKVLFILLFRTTASLLIFHLDDLLIDVIEVLKYPTITVLLSLSSFMSVNICFIYSGAPVLGEYILMSVISSPFIYRSIII